MAFGTHSAWLGGHVRVGLEDSLWIGRGRLAESNAEQVRKIRAVIEDMGKEIATPAEARALLALRGTDTARLGTDTALRGTDTDVRSPVA
jgi:uncharacterized protein (DUF849 family)